MWHGICLLTRLFSELKNISTLPTYSQERRKYPHFSLLLAYIYLVFDGNTDVCHWNFKI